MELSKSSTYTTDLENDDPAFILVAPSRKKYDSTLGKDFRLKRRRTVIPFLLCEQSRPVFPQLADYVESPENLNGVKFKLQMRPQGLRGMDEIGTSYIPEKDEAQSFPLKSIDNLFLPDCF